MIKPNLFAQIESYAQENFVTETLAYILQGNKKIRMMLIERLLGAQRKMLRGFQDYQINTQVSYDIGKHGIGIIDLQLTSKSDSDRKIYVEVKSRSQEGQGQIQKYLNLRGHVAYLTPAGFELPHVGQHADRFLGHFFWHEVHSIIKSASANNILHKQFLQYLEERHMGPLKPITPKELRSAVHAVDFIRKSQALVENVRTEIEPTWVKEYGKNTGVKGATDQFASGGFYDWWYRTKSWRKPGKGSGFSLSLGISFDEHPKNGPMFYLNIGSSKKRFGRKLDSSSTLTKKFRELRKCGWEKESESEPEWGYTKYFKLGKGDIAAGAREQTQNVRRGMKELQHLRIIRLIRNRL